MQEVVLNLYCSQRVDDSLVVAGGVEEATVHDGILLEEGSVHGVAKIGENCATSFMSAGCQLLQWLKLAMSGCPREELLPTRASCRCRPCLCATRLLSRTSESEAKQGKCGQARPQLCPWLQHFGYAGTDDRAVGHTGSTIHSLLPGYLSQH